MCLACSLYAVDANLGEVTAYGKTDISATEGTGSYTTQNMNTATGSRFNYPRNAANRHHYPRSAR